MALTSAEEALVRLLLDEQAALLSLAGSEATIISKLGATKVTLSDLVAASSVNDSDLLLIRQATSDKSVTPLVLKTLISPDASETVKGIVELATSAETIAGTDTARAVHPAGLAAALIGSLTRAFNCANLTMLQSNYGASAGGEWSRNANYGTYYKAPAAGAFADMGLASSGGTYALWISESEINLSKSDLPIAAFDGKIGTAVSTSPTTILDSAQPFGCLHIINGNSAGNIFSDLVYASNSQFLVLASHSASGAPVARTYSVVPGGTLKLAMASGTYAVTASRMRGSL